MGLLGGLALSFLLRSADPMTAALEQEQGGDDAQARNLLEGVVRAHPSWELPRLELARMALKQGALFDLAEYHLQVAEALAPENPKVHFLRGLLLEERQKWESARQAYVRAIQLRPSYEEARQRLATVCLTLHDAGAAAVQLEAVKAQNPGATQARLALADAREQLGDSAGAERELVALHREHAQNVSVRRRLAAFYVRTGRPRLAMPLERGPDGMAKRKLRPLLPSRR